MKKTALCFALDLLFICSVVAANKTDREHDALIGQVSAIRFEKSVAVNRSGQWVEGPRVLWRSRLEVARAPMTSVPRVRVHPDPEPCRAALPR